MLLSLKCRLYGEQSHTPCSGTIDDGTERQCECSCHDRANGSSIAAQAREDVRQMWNDAFGHNP